MSMAPQLESHDRDRRREVAIRGMIRVGSDREEIAINDISISGFNASLGTRLTEGTRVSFSTASLGTHEAEVVWSRDDVHGFRLIRLLSSAAVEQARQIDNIATVIFGPARAPIADSNDFEPDVEKWPRHWRAAFIGGGAIIAWGLIGYWTFG